LLILNFFLSKSIRENSNIPDNIVSKIETLRHLKDVFETPYIPILVMRIIWIDKHIFIILDKF